MHVQVTQVFRKTGVIASRKKAAEEAEAARKAAAEKAREEAEEARKRAEQEEVRKKEAARKAAEEGERVRERKETPKKAQSAAGGGGGEAQSGISWMLSYAESVTERGSIIILSSRSRGGRKT